MFLFYGIAQFRYKRAIEKEFYEKANVLTKAINLKNKPQEYIIELSEEFHITKQNIIDDIKYLEKEKKERDTLKENEAEETFYDIAVDDFKYIVLGNDCGAEFIIDTMNSLSDSTELLILLIWAINNFHKEHSHEILREPKVFKRINIIMTIKKFPVRNWGLKRIEKRYFASISKIIKEKKNIGGSVLVAILKYYNNSNTKQQEILSYTNKKSLLNGIKHAIKEEEYEIAQIINIHQANVLK